MISTNIRRRNGAYTFLPIEVEETYVFGFTNKDVK